MKETKEEVQTVYVVAITNYFKPQNQILSHFYLTFSFPPTKEHILKELKKGEKSFSGQLLMQIHDFVNDQMTAKPVEPEQLAFGAWDINAGDHKEIEKKEIERIECMPCEVVNLPKTMLN
jgi:hypothetical protein